MRELSENRENMFAKLKRKIYEKRRDICFTLRNFIYAKTKDMCFEKCEMEEIEKRVERTKESERKFDEFSQIAPDILMTIERLKNDVKLLSLEKEFCMNGIRDIYIAYEKNNTRELEILFAKFGLPWILEN